MEVSGTGFQGEGYDQTQRAFVITRQNKNVVLRLQVSLQASSESPLMNPAFVIKNWGEAKPRLLVDGKPLPQGSAFRYGLAPSLEGNDLVIWLQMQTETPTKLELTEAK